MLHPLSLFNILTAHCWQQEVRIISHLMHSQSAYTIIIYMCNYIYVSLLEISTISGSAGAVRVRCEMIRTSYADASACPTGCRHSVHHKYTARYHRA